MRRTPPRPFARLFLWSILVASLGALHGCDTGAPKKGDTSPNQPAKSVKSTEKTVQISIDTQESSDIWEQSVPWTEGLTVFELLLEQAEAHQELDVKAKGVGETGFVKAIFGIENDQASGRAWIYYVNDEMGEVGAGVKDLIPGDQVLWKYGTYN